MFWEKKDEQRLIDADEEDYRCVEAAKRKLEKVRPQFNEMFAGCLARQAQITKELIEIISGAEAL